MGVNLNKKDLTRFLINYNIGQLISYKHIKKGFGNVVVDTRTTEGRYIIKIALRNNPVRVKYEVDLLNHIKNLPTPRPVPTKQGKYLLYYNKTNRAFIYEYLPGREIKNLTRKEITQVGSFLGNLHKQTHNFKSNVKRLEYYNINQKSFRQMIRVSKGTKDKLIRKWVYYMEENLLDYILPQSLPQGAMHIDLKPENLLFQKRKLTGVIDFDNAYNGPLLLDLANTMMWFCSKNGKFNLQEAQTIYKSYVKVRKLNKQEKRYLFNALHYAFLSHMLIDIYLYVSKTDRLPLSYIKFGIANLLETEKNLSITHKQFNHIFN